MSGPQDEVLYAIMDVYAEEGGSDLWTCLPIAPKTRELTAMHHPPNPLLCQLNPPLLQPNQYQRPTSPHPSPSLPAQSTNIQAQEQAMREFLTALELGQATGAHEYHVYPR